MASVSIKGAYKMFGDVIAVNDVTLDIDDGEFLVLVGPSGCGKTTTLRMLAGFERPSYGTISIGDRIVNRIPPKDRNLAMVFQSYALYPHMDVAKNLSFGMRIRHTGRAEIKRRVHEVAETLGLEDLLARKPGQLSGGQRQRVALGRALLREPQVFLMDEPLSNLDAALRVQMRLELSRLHKRTGITTVYVTHDQVEAMTMGTRIAVMNGGRLQQCDAPERLYDRPANLFVAGFIGSPKMNISPARLRAGSGTASVDWVGHSVDVPTSRVGAARSREVVAGLRPEDLRAEDDAPSSCTARLEGLAEVVEPLGSETYVAVKLGDVALMARFPSRSGVSPGDTVRLAYDPGHLHLFDAESGVNLLSANDSVPATAQEMSETMPAEDAGVSVT